ncbi:MAG: hypothetical protein P0Y60_02605 [Candidatus Microbacterium colombiense]|nr:MAG: hypothetical protein P0Y60_02605 [Microbacterium sp.]
MRLLSGLGAILFLILRGCVLWLLIPFAFLAWLLFHSWAQRATLRQALCWYDACLTLGLVRGMLRPLLRPSRSFSVRALPRMSALESHRIRLVGMDVVDLVG